MKWILIMCALFAVSCVHHPHRNVQPIAVTFHEPPNTVVYNDLPQTRTSTIPSVKYRFVNFWDANIESSHIELYDVGSFVFFRSRRFGVYGPYRRSFYQHRHPRNFRRLWYPQRRFQFYQPRVFWKHRNNRKRRVRNQARPRQGNHQRAPQRQQRQRHKKQQKRSYGSDYYQDLHGTHHGVRHRPPNKGRLRNIVPNTRRSQYQNKRIQNKRNKKTQAQPYQSWKVQTTRTKTKRYQPSQSINNQHLKRKRNNFNRRQGFPRGIGFPNNANTFNNQNRTKQWKGRGTNFKNRGRSNTKNFKNRSLNIYRRRGFNSRPTR